jgi:tetraacyldisaccharide 4'-kinase
MKKKPQRFILLLPFSFIYGFFVFLRNALYNLNILPSKSFQTPIVLVGNLSVGGTGKTPHVEYILKLIHPNFETAMLSRGYKRKTSGFILANEQTTHADIGDEPFQIVKKFKNIQIACDENRVRGVKKLLKQFPTLQCVVMDDGYQHRSIQAGLSILLTKYNELYVEDFLLPSGNLREHHSNSKRADIIIVTKTPKIFSPLERRIIRSKLNPQPYQKVYFSYNEYGDFIPLKQSVKKKGVAKEFYFDRGYKAILISGLANAENFEYFLSQNLNVIKHLSFSDHYDYTIDDAMNIRKLFDNIVEENKIIITTEKDMVKLSQDKFSELFEGLPFFYLPIHVKFHDNDEQEFNNQIINYVRNNKIDSKFHKE